MNVDRAVFTLAGSMLLISLALAWLASPYMAHSHALCRSHPAAVSIYGVLSPAAIIFRKLGLKDGPAFESPLGRA